LHKFNEHDEGASKSHLVFIVFFFFVILLKLCAYKQSNADRRVFFTKTNSYAHHAFKFYRIFKWKETRVSTCTFSKLNNDRSRSVTVKFREQVRDICFEYVHKASNMAHITFDVSSYLAFDDHTGLWCSKRGSWERSRERLFSYFCHIAALKWNTFAAVQPVYLKLSKQNKLIHLAVNIYIYVPEQSYHHITYVFTQYMCLLELS
jgi:hypothetical protein